MGGFQVTHRWRDLYPKLLDDDAKLLLEVRRNQDIKDFQLEMETHITHAQGQSRSG